MGQEMVLYPGMQVKIHYFSGRGRDKNLILLEEGQEILLWPGSFINTKQKYATLPLKAHHRYALDFSSMGRRGKNTEKYYLQSPGTQKLSKIEGRPGGQRMSTSTKSLAFCKKKQQPSTRVRLRAWSDSLWCRHAVTATSWEWIRKAEKPFQTPSTR